MRLKFVITVLISLISFFIVAQTPELKASVSKNKLGINQRLRIEFSINKSGCDNFKVPSFNGFKIVGGPSQSVSSSWINGKTTFNKTYTYIIQPIRKGEITISPAIVEIDGKIISSKPLKITVTDAVAIPKDPKDPNYLAQQNIHLVAELSKASPYVGEGIYVEYRLYFSNSIGIYDNVITKMPQYNGFWNQEIKGGGITVKTAKYNGEDYRYVTLHKALLIPTKSGKLTINPMKMDIVVAVPTGRIDFFGNRITRKVKNVFSSNKKIITVKALPTENKPVHFNGAVGDFNYSVDLTKNSLKSNESSQIKVSVKGKGNLKLFKLPNVTTPSELEVYQPERKEKVRVTSSGIVGSVSKVYTVVPEYKGKYKIPSTSFSYFNPKEGKYHTITSGDIYVNVLEGKNLLNSSVSQKDTSDKKIVQKTGKDFRYIQTKTSFLSKGNDDFLGSILFYSLLLLCLLLAPIVILFRKRQRNKSIEDNKNKNDRLARKYLANAQKNIGNKNVFYERLELALHNYLKSKLKIQTSDISREKIKELLKEKGVEERVINNFIDVFNDCDFARYTPITNSEMEQEYEKAKQVITELDKQL